jgi:hypothetical protein
MHRGRSSPSLASAIALPKSEKSPVPYRHFRSRSSSPGSQPMMLASRGSWISATGCGISASSATEIRRSTSSRSAAPIRARNAAIMSTPARARSFKTVTRRCKLGSMRSICLLRRATASAAKRCGARSASHIKQRGGLVIKYASRWRRLMASKCCKAISKRMRRSSAGKTRRGARARLRPQDCGSRHQTTWR